MVCSLTGGHFHGLREPQRGVMTFRDQISTGRVSVLCSRSMTKSRVPFARAGRGESGQTATQDTISQPNEATTTDGLPPETRVVAEIDVYNRHGPCRSRETNASKIAGIAKVTAKTARPAIR